MCIIVSHQAQLVLHRLAVTPSKHRRSRTMLRRRDLNTTISATPVHLLYLDVIAMVPYSLESAVLGAKLCRQIMCLKTASDM
jgi:hypothetical protein